MNTTDEPPPPDSISPEIVRIVRKISNRKSFTDYLQHIASAHANQYFDILSELKNQLLLDGLDDEDIHVLHQFIKINFDGDLIKIADLDSTKTQAQKLYTFVDKF